MIGSYARRLRDRDYPWGSTRDERDAFCHRLLDEWGGPVGIEERAPSRAHDLVFRNWWASYLRMGSSPGAAVALTRMNAEIDVRGVLPSIRVPTLVVHRRGDRAVQFPLGIEVASRIPDARFVPLDGEDHLAWEGDQRSLVEAILAFLGRSTLVAVPDTDGDADALSTREREILRLVARGLGDKQIAEALSLSPHTVHRHVANIRLKLGQPTRTAAVNEAARLELI